MSRGNKNIKVDSAHPFIEFDTVYNTYYDKQEKRDRTVIIGRTPLVQGLTDDILMTGDLNTLKTFMQENQDKLNDNEKAYMQARIEASETIDSLRKKAYSDIAEGKQPQGPEPQNQNGYIGFPELRSPGVQSSGNGCWSVAYSMLLKSRGVDLSQENIRCWRPDQTKNPVEKAQQLESARNALIYRMNTDGANTISQNSDLMTQVLPNTEMRTVKVSEPPHEKYFTVDGKKTTEKDFEKIKENYIDQSTRFFVNIVNKAIKEDHSPIAITYHGHYMTITGISPDGTKIRCEDSFGSTAKDRTKYYDVKSVVEDAMTVRKLENGEKLPPTGYELTWLHDLKVPEYDKRNEQALDIEEIQNRFISLDEGGNLTVDAPLTVQNASNNGSASEGQLEGKGLEFPVQMDMKELSDALGGKKIVNLINPDGAYQMGQYDTYLPNKVYYGKDPQLQQYRQNSVDSGQILHNIAQNQDNLDYTQNVLTQNGIINNGGTNDATKDATNEATKAGQVYSGDETLNMMNSAKLQQMMQNSTQMDQSQMQNNMQVNPGQMQTNMQMSQPQQQNHQFNPDFYATVRKLNRMAYELKKTNYSTDSKNTNPLVGAMFSQDYNNLKAHIKNDQVLLSNMKPNWEQEFDTKFTNDREDFIYDITSEFSNKFNIPQALNKEFDSQFVATYFRLKEKIENAERAKQTPQFADKYISQDVNKLLNYIGNDAYLNKEFFSDFRVYNFGYSKDPINSTKGFLGRIEETLELSKYYDVNGNKLQNPNLSQKEKEFQNSLKAQSGSQINQTQSQPTQTQPNQTQPTANQTQPTGQHQFDPEFISVMISLKDKAQFVKDEKMLKNSAEARLKNDFEVLIQQIKKDPYISGAFNSQNLENELNVGFNNDPAGFTLRLVDNISNGLGIQSQLQQPGMSQPTANQTNQTQTTNLNQTTSQTQPNTSSTTATQPNTSSTTTANSTANKNFQRINIYDVNNQIEHRWHFMRDNINKAGVLSAIGRKNMIAEIVALSEIGARKRAKGIQNPTASPEEIADFTKQVKKNAAFNRLISNGNDLNIIKSQDTQKLLNGLVRSIWDIEDEKRYDISDKKSLVQKRCKFLANKLEATSASSGKKRTRKEDDYTNALNVVKELADKDNPNPHDVKTAVDTVKRYLADKMTQRSNTLDRERWGHFMLFLKETMPRKDFEKYCQEINKARGVAEKTNSKKYVSPEMFGYKKEPVESMLAETRHRIQSGKGTDRDYAFAIAIRNRFNNVGFLDNGKTLENEVDRQRIVKDTEKILKSENFRRFMTEISEERRRTMLNGDADDLYRFQNMLEPVAQRSSTIAEPQNNNNSIRRKNTQRSHNSSVSSSLGK